MKKRILSILLALTAVMNIAPIQTRAALEESKNATEKFGKWGYAEEDKEIIPFVYDEFFVISEGLAIVKKDGKFMCIDETGAEAFAMQSDYDRMSLGFSEGLAFAYKSEKCGFIDNTGNEVIPFIYDSACAFSDGVAYVTKGEVGGLIDKSGKEITPFVFTDFGFV